jgi:hypothetical protein
MAMNDPFLREKMEMLYRQQRGMQDYGYGGYAQEPEKKEKAPEKPKHLNPKLLLLKGA